MSVGRRPPQDDAGDRSGDLASSEIAALAFERVGDGAAIRVWALDVEGEVRELARRPWQCGVRCIHVEILGELLARGLRSRGSILVAADGCTRLVERLQAAFPQGIVVLPVE
jgi:hypothetical protein